MGHPWFVGCGPTSEKPDQSLVRSGLRLAVKEQGVGLVDGGHADAGDIDVGWPVNGPDNGVGNIFWRERG